MGGAPDVAIVGAGPVGLVLALELARFGVASAVLEAKPAYEPQGSKAMVLARHAFDALARVGCGELAERAVVLERARTYFRETELFHVEFAPPAPGETPLFGNLQQTHVERALLREAEASPLVEVRWGARVDALDELPGRFVVACDGARSTVRALLGIDFPGRSFDDRFLISDVRADLPFPNERRFHFDPSWNRGRQVLIHPEPDGEWRLDWQVPPATDLEEERRTGRIDERVRRIVGEAAYELVWITAYRFHERVAARFRTGRTFLAGDAAHLVAPFGARGLNSGIEDARNLGWRLALVARGDAPESLLDGYETERRAAALENVRVTSATMRFMAPPTSARRLLRNAILRGSLRSQALRRRVDSGRLATPATYAGEPPVGRLAPRDAVREPASLGFEVGRFGGAEWLVRPDGYVAAAVRGDREQAVRTAVAAVR